MTSTRPYLIRAFYDWIIDNDCTPYLVINAKYGGVIVPQHYVDNGQIILNIAVSAVKALSLGDRAIEFDARFDGKLFHVFAPMMSVIAIYARENGRGMVFAEDEGEEENELSPFTANLGTSIPKEEETSESKSKNNKIKKKGPPHLTIVKK